jgi:hypothetical protein
VYALPIDKIKYYRMQSPCDIYSRGHLSACGRCKISEPAVIFTSFPKFHSILLFVLITTQIKYSHYFRCFIYLFFVRHCQNLRIFSFVTDFDKCDNLSKRNVKLILKILSDLEPLRGSSNKKTLYSTRSCVNWAFFGTRGPLKRSFHSRFNLAHSYQKKPILHTNSLNK